jgi:hypothetical protein
MGWKERWKELTYWVEGEVEGIDLLGGRRGGRN